MVESPARHEPSGGSRGAAALQMAMYFSMVLTHSSSSSLKWEGEYKVHVFGHCTHSPWGGQGALELLMTGTSFCSNADSYPSMHPGGGPAREVRAPPKVVAPLAESSHVGDRGCTVHKARALSCQAFWRLSPEPHTETDSQFDRQRFPPWQEDPKTQARIYADLSGRLNAYMFME